MFSAFAVRLLVRALSAPLALVAERIGEAQMKITVHAPETLVLTDATSRGALRERCLAHFGAAAGDWIERVLRDGDGKEIGVLALVTRRPLEREEEELVELAAAGAAMELDDRRRDERLILSERMASMGVLAAGIAHEINNPLTYMKANVEHVLSLLRSMPGIDDDMIAALEDAHDGAERVREIVQQLRTFSPSASAEHVVVDVERVIDSALAIANNEIRHRAKLTKLFRHPPPVRANEARLAQVILNLLLNAVQAIPEGTSDRSTLRIETGLDATGRVFVEVADSGGGIPAGVIGRIFDPFFTTKPVGVGSGLGLAVAHSIVTAMNGAISVDSTEGIGSVFRVTLPADPSSMPAPKTPPPKVASSPPRTPRVLVVDDDPRILKVVRRTLGRDHEVEVASGGHDALARLAATDQPTFDVVLCDVMMPDISGVDVYLEVERAWPDLARRFVFMTGGAFTARAQDFIARSDRPLLAKPFRADDVRRIVASLTKRRS